MSISISRHVRPNLGTTLLVGAVMGALALHVPPRAAACDAAVAPAPAAAPHVRTASAGEVARPGRCGEEPLPPLALVAAALAMLAVPRARQGTMLEL